VIQRANAGEYGMETITIVGKREVKIAANSEKS
jgi:hypothetical protein